jgi:hypothetical protein
MTTPFVFNWSRESSPSIASEAIVTTDPSRVLELVERQRDHWQKLHTTQFTPEEFEAWIRAIPGCSTCQRDFRKLIETNSPRFNDWNRWTWEIHNAVNVKIGKPELTWLEACQQWGWD